MGFQHEEYIQITDEKGKVVGHGFMTGVPDKCQHDYSDLAFTLGNGDVILEKDIRCPTSESTSEYLYKIAEERNTHVSGGTSACSICGKIYSPMQDPSFWEE